jgi:hypothetical protein
VSGKIEGLVDGALADGCHESMAFVAPGPQVAVTVAVRKHAPDMHLWPHQ